MRFGCLLVYLLVNKFGLRDLLVAEPIAHTSMGLRCGLRRGSQLMIRQLTANTAQPVALLNVSDALTHKILRPCDIIVVALSH